MTFRQVARNRMWLRLAAAAVALMLIGCGEGGSERVRGGEVKVSFDDASSANLSRDRPPATDVIGYEGRLLGALAFVADGQRFMAKRWQVQIGLTSTPSAAGQTFMLGAVPVAASAVARLTYQETPPEGGFREWTATSGVLTVTRVEGRTVGVAFTSVPMQPSMGGSGNSAVGTFTLSGELTVDDAQQALPD